MQWRFREKRNDEEHHEKASFFHLAMFRTLFLFCFCENVFFNCYVACYVICSCRKTFKQPFTDVFQNKCFSKFRNNYEQLFHRRPVHYTFPKFYLTIDNLYFRVIFYYCKILYGVKGYQYMVI